MARLRAVLQRRLGRWFRSAKRDLPWRGTRDPYAIWISEAMLQQTRVETVIPYYRRFLARFPDLGSLAAADEGEVLALWSGLGYYSRARALREAARVAVRRHGGELPRTHAEWLALPGVGPYTAGAVTSMAFSAHEALVDGNVQRVFARLFALEDAIGSRALTERCWALARALVPGPGAALDPGDWNQGLMELGACVCTARTPDCAACPLRGTCRANALGRVLELPHPRPRRPSIEVRVEIFVVRSGERILCVQRPDTGRMAGLFEFPTRELTAPGSDPYLWPAEPGLAGALEPGPELGRLTHAITHHRVRATVRLAALRTRRLPATAQRSTVERGKAQWVKGADLAGLALTGLAHKVLALAPQAVAGTRR